MKVRFMEYTTNYYSVNRFSHLSCGSLQLLPSNPGPLSCISHQGCPYLAKFRCTAMLESSILVAELNKRSSIDVTALTSPGIVKPAENKLSLPFPACLTGRNNGGVYLERQNLAGELLLHKAIPERA
ncbi:hypothetical protein ILYODFUR_036096 [Ilyodon furcidens]|uniref:Uncharacterized protein n=1 Tax=Ilyodon furcidens TaxID=33524 RepID=A0ABV0VMX1_9TELE